MLEAFEKLAAEERFSERPALAVVAALQRWTNAGRMVASAAHEMRGALTIAQMNIEYLATELCKQMPQEEWGELSQAAEEARQGILRALSSTQNVLALAHSTSPAVIPLSAVDAVERAVAAVAPRLRGLPSIEIAAENVPLVLAEAGALHQVLVNLLLNAADAVSEARRQGSVRVRVSASVGSVRISVSDNGAEKKADPRASGPAPEPVPRDAGLGLSFSQMLVRAFGADLSGGQGGALGGCEFTLLLRSAAGSS